MKVYENEIIVVEFRKEPLTEDDSMSILIKSHGPHQINRRYYGKIVVNPISSKYFISFRGLPVLVLLDYYCKINIQEFEKNVYKAKGYSYLDGLHSIEDAVQILKAIVFYNEF